MIRIALVHGAWHRASCWDAVARELAAAGHDVVTPELPSDRPGLGAEAYAGAVIAALGPLAGGTRVVLVGHSLGGLTVPVVAQRLGAAAVHALVLVAALVPRPGMSLEDQVRAEPAILAPGVRRGQQRHPDGTTSWPPEAAVAGLYRGVAEELTARAAAGRIVLDEPATRVVERAVAQLRPQAWDIGREITPLVEWPDVRTVAVVCSVDRVVGPVPARRRAAELGSDVVELPGGHFPMLVRPRELASVLMRVASAR
ncbi:MAG TPA: alpha/beta hydrolase [Pseudonocardia sp.]|nr:alpha/beta hydrolase [Pseudonocardia sp.]